MISEEELTEALQEFSTNPYWRAYYEEAPSKAAKQRVKLVFFWSLTKDKAKYHEAIEEAKKLEEQYTIADCRHELKFCGHNPGIPFWKRKIESLSQANET